MPEPPANCSTCGAPLPQGARFCPSCGTATSSGDTERAEIPAHETGPVPVTVERATPRWFGVTPPTLLFALAAVALAVAVFLLVTGSWVAGPLVLGIALLLAAAFLEAGRRKPDAQVVRASVDAVDSVQARAGATAQALLARSSARREIIRRRAELLRLGAERERLLRELGEEVYRGGDGARVRGLLAALDERARALEAEAAEIAERARARVQQARLQVQPTEVVDSGERE